MAHFATIDVTDEHPVPVSNTGPKKPGVLSRMATGLFRGSVTSAALGFTGMMFVGMGSGMQGFDQPIAPGAEKFGEAAGCVLLAGVAGAVLTRRRAKKSKEEAVAYENRYAHRGPVAPVMLGFALATGACVGGAGYIGWQKEANRQESRSPAPAPLKPQSGAVGKKWIMHPAVPVALS